MEESGAASATGMGVDFRRGLSSGNFTPHTPQNARRLIEREEAGLCRSCH
jgi:hypothetical protein